MLMAFSLSLSFSPFPSPYSSFSFLWFCNLSQFWCFSSIYFFISKMGKWHSMDVNIRIIQEKSLGLYQNVMAIQHMVNAALDSD